MTLANPEPAAAVSLRCRALALWLEADPATKAAQTRTLWVERDRHPLDTGPLVPGGSRAPQALQAPGRPVRPGLVPPRSVPSRTPFTLAGRAALLHSIAHIEFNAINLALDAVWRFDAMPEQFYVDWLQVAGEEAVHFSLLREHLLGLGFDYGDFDAHDGLWLMTQRTADDVMARMALVPRTLEARGLDATPPLRAKFERAGDARTVEILDIILRDEIGHVATGNRWYRWLCAQRGLDPVTHYGMLAERYEAPRLRPPFNHAARRAAGFTDEEVALLG
ncbi:MAG: ferritin-like domain-containing protein [Burkholderiaceae bacterium]|nr:ferritin-like domain-containing protein [Burkholderiaceae bacterium]